MLAAEVVSGLVQGGVVAEPIRGEVTRCPPITAHLAEQLFLTVERVWPRPEVTVYVYPMPHPLKSLPSSCAASAEPLHSYS